MELKRILQLSFILILVLTLCFLYMCTLHFSDEHFLNHYARVVLGAMKTAFANGRNTVVKLENGRYVTLCSGSYNSRRTGNQLFNFATLMYVAKSTGRQMYMPKNIRYGWIDAFFDVNVTRVDKYETAYCPCVIAEEDPHGAMKFDPRFDDLGKNESFVNATTIFICGYFQSWKYTRGIEEELHRVLRFRPEISSAVTKFFREQVSSRAANVSYTTIGIHVRRGDFLEPKHMDAGFMVADSTYLNHAIDYHIELNQKSRAQEKLIFIVCSDDLAWVKSALNVSANTEYYNVTFVYSEKQSTGFDMCLLSRCDSLIISTGSFSWWAAWLSNRTVVYYKNYPRPGSKFAQGFRQEDYYPSNWIPML